MIEPNYHGPVPENWENVTLTNNYLFCKIMESETDLCKHLIELFLHIEIDHLEIPKRKNSFMKYLDSTGVLFNAIKKHTGQILNVEIQMINDEKNLPELARKYQSIIDYDDILSGLSYRNLRDTYIIFICMHDPFEKGLPVYTFESTYVTEDGHEIHLNDGSYKIFYNINESEKFPTKDKRNFFNYLKENSAEDDFTKKLEEKVQCIKADNGFKKTCIPEKETVQV